MNATVDPEATTAAPLYSYQARVGLACVWLLASVLGIAGNSLVIASVLLSRRVRTVTNAFVINLAAADLWTSLCYPWEVVAVLSRRGWPLASEFPCALAAVQLYTGFGASLYSLAMIALNRFVLVTRSRAIYRRCYSTGGVVAMIAATWTVPCLVFFLPPALGVGDFGYDPQDKTCSDKDAHPRGPEYNLIQSMGLYPLPMLVIVASYTALYVHLRRHFGRQLSRSGRATRSEEPSTGAPSKASRRDGELKSAAGPTGDSGPVGPGRVLAKSGSSEQVVETSLSTMGNCTVASRGSMSRRAAISRRQLAITKNLFLVFCVFFLLMSPYFISLAVPNSQSFALYGATFSILNSCVNPVIYTASHPIFKAVLRKMLLCRFSEIPEPSDWLKSLLSRRA